MVINFNINPVFLSFQKDAIPILIAYVDRIQFTIP